MRTQSFHSIFVLLFLAVAASIASAQESQPAQELQSVASKKKVSKTLPKQTEADKIEEARRKADQEDGVKIPSTEPETGSSAPLVVTSSAFTTTDFPVIPTVSTDEKSAKSEEKKEEKRTEEKKTAEKAKVKASAVKVEPKTSTVSDPVLGTNLKTEKVSVSKEESKDESKEEESTEATELKVAWGETGHNRRNPIWFTQTIGFLHSKWNKFNGGLNKGSLTTSFYVSQEVLPSIEWGLGMNWIRGINSNGASDDIRNGLELRANGRYRLMPGVISPHAALDVSFGSFKAWKAVSNAGNQVTFEKSAGGTLAGLSPGFGASARIFGRSRIDLTAQYQFYFGKAARNVGGVTIVGAYALGF